ncbi:RNA-binding protein MEX3D-like [Passer montanus]|uniref:RNA-binding protein MEX3D-like n=1 Tax=Passer montanus TaxID=9160 RepID=UPI0019608082|nr:RNA-binding protein MEX3D-like [Passer montanus]
MSRRPRAAEPSPPARRRNETHVKVDRGNPFRRRGAGGGRAAGNEPAAVGTQSAPTPPSSTSPAARPRLAPCAAPPSLPCSLKSSVFYGGAGGSKKRGVSGERSPPSGHGDTGDLREHHGHRAGLVTNLRSSRKRLGTAGRAAVVAPSPHAAVPVLPRGLEEGQVPTGDRLPPVPLRPPSLRAAVTAHPSARVSR